MSKILSTHGIYCFLISITPILNEYDFVGLPFRLGFFILIITAVFSLPTVRFNNQSFVTIIIAIVIFYIVSLYINGTSIDFINRFMNILVCIFIIAILPQTVTYNTLRPPITFVLLVSSMGLVAQIIMFQYFGSFLSLALDNALLSQHETEYFNITTSISGTDIYRPSSFFIEPSRFGLFLGFALHFISVHMRSLSQLVRVYGLGFIVAALSTSGTAMVLVLISMIFKINTLDNKVGRFALFLISLFILFGIYFSSIGYVFERFVVSGGRLFNGMFAFNSLGYSEYLFGLGLGQGKTLMSNYDFPFVSGLPLALIEFGIVGTSFLVIIILLFAHSLKSKLARQFIYLWMICLIFEQVLFGYWMILPIVFAIIVERRRGYGNYAINHNTN